LQNGHLGPAHFELTSNGSFTTSPLARHLISTSALDLTPPEESTLFSTVAR
jgi:hypothetical protein